MKLTRRSVLRAAAATLAAPALGATGLAGLAGSAAAQSSNPGKTWKHGLSLFGDLKYAEGFKNFDYVNPQAPQGGVSSATSVTTTAATRLPGRRPAATAALRAPRSAQRQTG